MPGLNAALVSLEDVLEVQNGALNEPELWSILCLTAEALQDLLFKGLGFKDEVPSVVVTPQSLYMRPDGKITLDPQAFQSFAKSDFCAPEWKGDVLTRNDASLEKLWIFSLGLTLYKAADYNCPPHQELNISPELHSVLSEMCEEDSESRLSLTQVMQYSSTYAASNMSESFSTYIMRMYELVMGSGDNMSIQLTNPSSISSSPHSININTSGMYDIRPAPVGKSANEDTTSRASNSSNKHFLSTQHLPSNHIPLYQHIQSPTSVAEDSLRLTRQRVMSQRTHQQVNRITPSPYSSLLAASQMLQQQHRQQSSPHIPLLQAALPQRSMPALNISHMSPTVQQQILLQQRPHSAMLALDPTRSQYFSQPIQHKDPYVQEAYNRLVQRKALLTAIRQSLSSDNLADPLQFLTQQHQYRINDIQASVNSLNYGAFQPGSDHQKVSRILPYTAEIERPKSAHPRLYSEPLQDETDAILHDPVVREAMLSSRQNLTQSRNPIVTARNRSEPNLREAATPAISDQPNSGNKVISRPPSGKRPQPSTAGKVRGGPEFVRLSTHPVKKIKDLGMPKSGGKSALVAVLVELLNGERLQFFCPAITTGSQLFELMLREVDIPQPEQFLFGLTHAMGGEHFFLDNQKKIEKYIPALKKRSLLKKDINVAFTVHQRVKFYVQALSQIRHTKTRHLLYLQLRRDIIEDRLRGEDQEMITLAGIALQAEYGDYDIRRHHLDYFTVSYYFPQRMVKRIAKAKQLIVNKHAANCGLTCLEAETRFIEEAMELHEYGVHFHSACKTKGDPLSQTWLGVTAKGIALAEKRAQNRAIVQRCSWANIAKLSFNKEKFIIKPHAHTDDPNKICRYTESYKKSKYLMALAEDHHAFLLHMMSRGDYPSVQQRALPATDEAVVEGMYDEYPDEYSEGQQIDYDDDEDSNHSAPAYSRRSKIQDIGEASSYQYQQASHQAMETQNDTDEDTLTQVHRNAATIPRRPSNSRRQEVDVIPDISADVPELAHDIEETLSESLHERFDAIPIDSPEKKMIVVRLRKDPAVGVGIHLAGIPGTAGLFIAKITPNGPAHREGSIKVGDRLVAINGRSTEVISQQHAMELIKKSNADVEIIVSQSITTGSAFTSEAVVRRQSSGEEQIVETDSDVIVRSQPKTKEQLKAELMAEAQAQAAADSDEPITDEHLMMQYEQKLALYHPKIRAQTHQAQNRIQLPTPPQPSTISPQSISSNKKVNNIRKELDDMSSVDMASPVSHTEITNIDDISSEGDDDMNQSDLDEASALQTKHYQQYSSRQVPSSLSSYDAEESQISSSKPRQSAFASVTSADKPPKHSEKIEMRQFSRSITPNKGAGKKRETALRNDMTSPSVTSTLSEHDSEMTEPHSTLSSRMSQKSSVAEPKEQQTKNAQADEQKQNKKLHLSIYDSDSNSSTLQSEHDEVDAVKPESVQKQNSMPSGIKIAAGLLNQKLNKPTQPTKNDIMLTELKQKMLPGKAEETSEDEEVSSALAGRRVTGGVTEHVRPTSDTSNARVSETSFVEPGPYDIKLKTPIDDHLEPGDAYELTLNKVNQTLGLNVTGGINTSVRHGGIYVKSLVPRGPADMSARIHIGDRVLSVNGIVLTSVTHKQAVETLRSAATPVTLQLERGELKNKQPEKKTTPKPQATSVESTPREFVSPVGDDINHESLSSPASNSSGSKASPVAHALSAASTPGYKTPDIEKISFVNSTNCFEVRLQKGRNGLGFSVLGGKDPMSPDPRLSLVRVKKVFPNGAADKSGELNVGDIILRVNGKSVEGLSHSETVSLLRMAPSEVELYICRPDPRILSPTSESILNNSLMEASKKSMGTFNKSPHSMIDDLDHATKRTPENTNLPHGDTLYSESSESLNTISEPNRSDVPEPAPAGEGDNSLEETSSMSSESLSGSEDEEVISVTEQRAIALNQHVRSDFTDTRSSISANSSTTMGTQESSTSKETVNTILKSPAVQEFEASLKLRKTEYGLPTPIRELDDMLQENTSNNTSRSQSPLTLSRNNSLTRSAGKLTLPAGAQSDTIEPVAVNLSQDLGSDDVSDSYSETSEDQDGVLEETLEQELSPPGILPSSPLKVSDNTTNTPEESDQTTPTNSVDDTVQLPSSLDKQAEGRDEESELNKLPEQSATEVEGWAEVEIPKPKPQIIEVTLVKDSYGSLGFSVAGSASLGGCYVKKIIRDAAISENKLQPGDKILSVNGSDVTKLSNPATVQLIKSQPETVVIIIMRPIDDRVPTTEPKIQDDTLQQVSSSISTPAKAGMNDSVTPNKPSRTEQPVVRADVSLKTTEQEPVVPFGHTGYQMKAVARVLGSEQESQKQETSLPESPATKQELTIGDRSIATDEDNDDDFSSVGDDEDIPENIVDEWSTDSDTQSESDGAEADLTAVEKIKESHIDAVQSKQHSEASSPVKTALLDTSIRSLTQESSADELDKLSIRNAEASSPAVDRPVSGNSISSWSDSIAQSDDDIGKSILSLSPVDLRRKESGKSSNTEEGISTPALTHNDSFYSKLSRHDSTHSNQSFISTPALSRNASMKLNPFENIFSVRLDKPEGGSLGFSIICRAVDGDLHPFIKEVIENGLAEKSRKIRSGDRLLKINDSKLEGLTQTQCTQVIRQCQGEVEILIAREQDSHSDELNLTHDEHDDEQTGASDDQLEGLGDMKSSMMLAPRQKIFGPSVTTTDEDSEPDIVGEEALSEALASLNNSIKRPSTSQSQFSNEETQSFTDESSADFDLPDESQFLETSIRLTRDDMKTPESDDTEKASDTDTELDHSKDDVMPNSTRNNTDVGHDDTDTEASFHDDPLPSFRQMGDWSSYTVNPQLDSSNEFTSYIPGAAFESDYAEPGTSKALQIVKGSNALSASTSNQNVVQTSSRPVRSKYSFERTSAAVLTEGSMATQGRQLQQEHAEPSTSQVNVALKKESSTVGKIQTDAVDYGSKISSRRQSSAAVSAEEQLDAVNVSGVFSKDIDMDWLNKLEVVTTPSRGMYTDVYLENLIEQLLTKIAKDDVSDEFKQLKSLKPTDNCDVAKLKDNKTKNRYRNVLPYDATRVILNNEDDYINASHLQKAMGKDCYQYIASQGPMPQTTADFWEMVIEQNVTLVAMTTMDVEGGKVKCHRYWPDSLHVPMDVSEMFEVTLTKIVELDDFVVRHLEVRDLESDKRHRVIHMNYTTWPDHGCPESAKPLLQFIRAMHELHTDGPILVHCSAGVGRTGTLITLDIVIGSIERGLKFDIHPIVTELRRQRAGMIQTKDQYLFCYTATIELLELLKSPGGTTKSIS